MNKRTALLATSLAALAAVGGIFFLRGGAPDPVPAGIRTVANAPASPPSAQPPQPALPEDGPAREGGESESDPEQDAGQVAFKARANGQIVMNEKTRLDLERLYALYTPAEREKKMSEIASTLPPEAARQLYQLMDQYQNYQAAMYQVYPPDREMTTLEQGISQIDGMHGLRVQYFGEQATQAMFGAEEKLQRELYRHMENETDPSLTLEEKVERAQRKYQEQHAR